MWHLSLYQDVGVRQMHICDTLGVKDIPITASHTGALFYDGWLAIRGGLYIVLKPGYCHRRAWETADSQVYHQAAHCVIHLLQEWKTLSSSMINVRFTIDN